MSVPLECDRRTARRGFTLTEMVMAVGILGIIIAGLAVFAEMATRSVSGITAQSFLNEQAGHAAEFILARVRLANTVSNDTSDDLPALMYNVGILDIHGNANICGGVYSPSFMEIENKEDGNLQYFNPNSEVGIAEAS